MDAREGVNVSENVAVIGMGYVGLPVALALSRQHRVIGFDLDSRRINELQLGRDRTGEVDDEWLKRASGLTFSSDVHDIRSAGVFVVCVPTPIDDEKSPDLGPLLRASQDVGQSLTPGDLVIYESTVYPGVTEEVCAPILEKVSGLLLNQDFHIGYSPERINPGDKSRRLEDIVKVVSGSTSEALDRVDSLYASVIPAGTYRAPSIKVAEAAKVIENTQRDLNIALVNELAQLFHRLDIDTRDVLAAAGTKWNFLPFEPGLVGGHCIGVDPYYLTFQSKQVGHNPEVILAGRTINDSMGEYVARRVAELVGRDGHGDSSPWNVLVLGATFKENCPDTRNSRVVDVVQALVAKSAVVWIADPWVAPEDQGGFAPANWIEVHEAMQGKGPWLDAVVVAVAHEEFKTLGEQMRTLLKKNGIIFDVKGALPRQHVDGRL